MKQRPPIWTFLPGLHGSAELFSSVKQHIPASVETDYVEYPTEGPQSYSALTAWLNEHLASGNPRLIIAESFSGPIALRLAASRPDEISGVVLVASFCDAPMHPGIALLPLRLLFMVQPPHTALRHFLIGDDVSDGELIDLQNVIKSLPSSLLASRVRTCLLYTSPSPRDRG